jgi:hypothetical protein
MVVRCIFVCAILLAEELLTMAQRASAHCKLHVGADMSGELLQRGYDVRFAARSDGRPLPHGIPMLCSQSSHKSAS